MRFAKEEACFAQNLALYAKVSREDTRFGEGSGIPAGYIGVFMKDGSKKDRSEFLDSCRHAINKGSVYLEVERLEYKDVMVLVPDKYFSFDKNNCRDGELLIKIPLKDGGIKLPGKIRKAVMDTEKAMDERKLGLCHSAVDIAFTPRSLSKSSFIVKRLVTTRNFPVQRNLCRMCRRMARNSLPGVYFRMWISGWQKWN